jgi:hypothetical protein
VKPVLSRRKVAALLQGLSQDEPDHKMPEPGPAKVRQEYEGFRGKRETRPVAEKIAS